jgi:hypothetical protein
MDIADVEGDAASIYRLARADESDPPSIATLCRAVTGYPPTVAKMREEGRCARVGDTWRVFVRRGLSAQRARFIVAHEIAEAWHRRIGYAEPDVEERCDALGAALVVPRAACAAVLRSGHSPKLVAEAFGVERPLALLRIGEVTGRPVLLVRRRPIARGEPFAWPASETEALRAVKAPPASVHPVNLGGRWGLMARV